jgi:diguanylate cyclase (GGDEF)-like protein
MPNSTSLGGWLVHVMRKADGALSLEEGLHVIMDSMKAYFPSQSVAVILIDEDTGELRIKISRQISYTFVKQYHRSEPGPLAEQVVLEQRPMLLNDVDRDSDVYKSLRLEHDFTSAVIAPVVRNQRGEGYIFCDREDHDVFDESDLLHLQVIGMLIGSMIERFELIQAGKRLSQMDDATKVLQYKAFVPAFGVERERAITHEYGIGLALIAVEAFRKVIEIHGIDQAHALLEEVAGIVKTNIREMDFIGRFGADEFILCLSGMTEGEIRRKLDTITTAVAEQAVGHGNGGIHVTVGALALDKTADQRRTLQDILGAVGRNLVTAKGQGAGSIVITPLPEEAV